MAVDAGNKYRSVEIDTGDHTPVGEDEPVFVIRSKDRHAVAALQAYAELCEAGGSPLDHLTRVMTAVLDVESWQQRNTELVGQPD